VNPKYRARVAADEESADRTLKLALAAKSCPPARMGLLVNCAASASAPAWVSLNGKSFVLTLDRDRLTFAAVKVMTSNPLSWWTAL
jgi:hypothetical protein